jgi:drug/metabolite transporter (DMT)-like permease
VPAFAVEEQVMGVKNSRQARGIISAVSGIILWGLTGTAAQYAFASVHLNSWWLVGVRMLGAGVPLLIWCGWRSPHTLFSVWRHVRTAWRLIVFALIGMVPSELAYFMAIRYGNAPTATVLQLTGPLFIVGILALFEHLPPRRIDLVAIIIALLGTLLVVTGGRFDQLALSPLAIIWGLATGLSQAGYTLLPRRLLEEFDATLVTGWAMVVGSVPFLPMLVRAGIPKLAPSSWLVLAFIVFAGTMVGYVLYLQSLAFIRPTTTAMLSAVEPLVATLAAVAFLHTQIDAVQLAGGLLVLSTVFLQVLPARRTKPPLLS